MQLPNWDEFSDFFAAQDDEPACARRRAFLEQHGEYWQVESELNDYQSTFMSVYGIHIDWKEGIFSLLEELSQILGERVFSAELDYDSDSDSDIETATIDFSGGQHVFRHYSIGSAGYSTEFARIEHLLLLGGYALRVHRESMLSDTLSFLLMPLSKWQRAEQQYGAESTSTYFTSYESLSLALDDEEPTTSDTRVNHQTSPYLPEPDLLNVWMVRAFLWCALPVLTMFIIYVLWGVLTRTEPLPTPQPEGCGNVEKMHSNLRPEVAEQLQANMRKSLGCK
ncbi:hypothetical protein D5073_17590 [Pectobacterium versatile]|nr:hypothetical protein [Pectobacterium versatile]ASN83963.1 Hypothetical protein SCC1_0491 [Pectobacterium versatile]MBQ4765162.1 hypothetical protein [Pectobacterium versatile]MBQ4796372.1 hypothetical protein [Pectobacterium versatile]RJL50891.1 hypothetical protein D5073_17590 [Pectobacterium versatile]RJL53629.1 hypothetical protein D5076_19085 [Pectobacterium versatile]